MADSLAILPPSLGKDGKPPGADFKPAKASFIPEERGGLLLKDPNEAPCPYTFTDSPAYLRAKEAEERAKRANELEGREETRGFLRSVEELGKKQKWEEVHQLLERRTAVPSGLFLVTRALVRWKFGRYGAAMRDIEQCLHDYGSSAKAGPLAGAFACFARICLGSTMRERESCSRELRPLVAAWEEAESRSLLQSDFAQNIWMPKEAQKLATPVEIVDGMMAHDGSYIASSGVKIGYVLLQNQRDPHAPVILHFHGAAEQAADYRTPAIAARYLDLNVHLLVLDYRGYGWSSSEPSLATFLGDAEIVAEKLQEVFLEHGLAWPYTGGLIVSGRSLGAQVAVHLATMYPTLFRSVLLESALATSVAGDRLGRTAERTAALGSWHKELDAASLDVLQSLDSVLFRLSSLEKIRGYDGQILVLHGACDDVVPVDSSETLYKAVESKQKELVVVPGANHSNLSESSDYWNALKRFALRVTLDDAVPSIGTVVHLCAVCREKAVAKCGRCEKVWYCGRKHQAEHWKEHKAVCAGQPVEAAPKPKAEGEACIVAAVVANIASDNQLCDLESTLQCLLGQDDPCHSIFVGWHAAGEELGDNVELKLASLRQTTAIPIVAIEADRPLSYFEHLRQLGVKMTQEVPKYAWVCFVHRSLCSPSYTSVLLPELRKAAVDGKVIAMSAARHTKSADNTLQELPCDAATVSALLSSGGLLLQDAAESERRLEDVVVKLPSMQSLLKAMPAAVLAHPLSVKLFLHKLNNSFGKKVSSIQVPEGQWMRYEREPLEEEEHILEEDKTMGIKLFDGVKSSGKLKDSDEAVREVNKLRRAVQQRVVLMAGQAVSEKDLKDVAREEAEEFLSGTGLDVVIGLNGWARQIASDLVETAAQQFEVRVDTR